MTIQTSLISYYEEGVENRSGWVNLCCGVHQGFMWWVLGLVGKSGLGTYGVSAFALGAGVCKVLCVSSKSGISIAPSYGTPEVKPCWSSKPNTLGDSPTEARLIGCGAWHGDQSFHTPWANFCNIIVLQSVGHPTVWYGNLLYNCVSPTLLLWFVPLHTHFFARYLCVWVCVRVCVCVCMCIKSMVVQL